MTRADGADRLTRPWENFRHHESWRPVEGLINALVLLVRNILAMAEIWRARASYRRELAARSERELQDMGTCWCLIADEISKPFWRS